MSRKGYTARNLSYLLWRLPRLRRDQWVAHLASWAGCTEVRAAALLRGAVLQEKEQKLIAKNAGCTEEQLQTEGFWEEMANEDEVNILQENLRLLTDKRMGKKLIDIAKESGLKRVSLSRWKSGKHEPKDEGSLARLVLYFGLRPDTNLKADPIFLEIDPVGTLMRKEWMHKQIEHIDNQTLNEFFPAFQRLLTDYEAN